MHSFIILEPSFVLYFIFTGTRKAYFWREPRNSKRVHTILQCQLLLSIKTKRSGKQLSTMSQCTHTHNLQITCRQVRPLSDIALPTYTEVPIIKGTIQRVRVILNHRPVKSRFNSRPRGSERSDWSLCRPRPLFVHSSSRDRVCCRLTYVCSAPKNA